MDIWLITLLAMWINPILGFFLIRFLKKRTKHIRWVLIFFASITIVEILSIITKISFKSTTADFIFTSVFYLGVCSSIWILIFNKKSIIKVIGIILAILIFGLNYLSSTIGALGVGFALNNWEPRQEICLGDQLKYKEIPLGMATDDYRGKRIEIYKQVWILPLERKILTKEYINEAPGYIKKLEINYNIESKELYLFGADTMRNEEIVYWYDTINIYNARKHNKGYSK
jgi:hypothetical protein